MDVPRVVSAAWVLMGAASMLGAEKYILTDLGTLGGSSSQASSVNDHGHVTGQSATQNGANHAFFWDGLRMMDLGTLSGTTSWGFGINNLDQIVGRSDSFGLSDCDVQQGRTTATISTTHGFLWRGQGLIDLGAQPLSHGTGGYCFAYVPKSIAWAINDAGQISGWGDVNWNYTFASLFRWNGLAIDPAIVTEYSSGPTVLPGRINVSGAMTGTFNFGAVRIDGNVVKTLGTFGGDYAEGEGINNRGDVVGLASTTGDAAFHAFLYNGQAMQDLGTLGGNDSDATAINDGGVVVGTSSSIDGTNHAFIWNGSLMSDLNSLVVNLGQWTLNYAHDINQPGQIVGYGTFAGQTRAFLLTPISVTQSSLVFSRATNRFRQTITVKNSGPTSIARAAFVADGLPSGVSLFGPSGLTSTASPTGSPYVELGTIPSGGTVTAVIEFVRTGTQAVTYSARILGDEAR